MASEKQTMPSRREFMRRAGKTAHVMACHFHPTATGALFAIDELQESGLAGTGGSGEKSELTLLQAKAHTTQGHGTRGV